MNPTRLDSITRLQNAARRPVNLPGVTTTMPVPVIATARGFQVRPLASLRHAAARRQPGYLEACLKFGALDATGQYITFSRDAFAQIRKQFSLKSAPIKVIKPCC